MRASFCSLLLSVSACSGLEEQPLAEVVDSTVLPLCTLPTYTNVLPADGTADDCASSPGPVGAPGAIRQVADPDQPQKVWDVYENLTYGVRGGRALQGDLWVPRWLSTLRPGLLISIHGGGWQACDRRRGAVQDVVRKMARDAGAAFFNIEYRLSQEGGMFPHNAMDVRCAVQFAVAKVRRYPALLPVDTERVALIGESAGAHLALFTALTQHREDLNPNCTDGTQPVPVPRIVAAYGFSPAGDLPALALGGGPAAGAPQLYTAGACSGAAPVDPSECGCGVPNRCADASPLQHSCGLLVAPQTRLTVVASPRTGAGAEYDALIPQLQSVQLVQAVNLFTPDRASLWIPNEASVQAFGCQANGVISDSAHGFSPCLLGPLWPFLIPALQAQIGGR
ncbi:MAG: alpha/beta hydrolase [Myxococcota bacterium]|nr:alpha/beta hydrolase [Myxococcota bacterium]